MVKKGLFGIVLLGFVLSPIGSSAFAKKFEVDSENVERIKLAFSFVGILANLGTPDALKNILNTILAKISIQLFATYTLFGK